MKTTVQFEVNGVLQRVATDDGRSLLEVLREDLHLTGTKYGCGEGQCRACGVLLDGQLVTSCLTPVSAAHGRQVETIEGLAHGKALHPVQQAFVDEDAMQCGYCVPGMVLASVALLRSNPNPTRDEIIQSLNGNLCRCCGYPNVLNAVERAAMKLLHPGKEEAP